MKEVPLGFGSDRHLIGTLTLPASTTPRGPAFILPNAGVVHRIGPHRLHVKLARALARQGHPCLRLDLSGVGDSRTPADAAPFQQQVVHDLRQAMDHLQKICSVDSFAIAGICSGAHNGLATALEDPRVKGLWMLDGYVYPTPRTHTVRLQRQLAADPTRTLLSWTRSAIERGARGLRGSDAVPAGKADAGDNAPPPEAFARAIQSLVDRGTSVYFMYTGSLLWTYNYPEQLRDAFAQHDFVHRVRCDYVPEIDHTATSLAAQRLVIERLGGWAAELAAAGATPA